MVVCVYTDTKVVNRIVVVNTWFLILLDQIYLINRKKADADGLVYEPRI